MPIEKIQIIIRDQSTLLDRIAQGYGTLSRVLMEYIDNAFDSADEFFDEKKQIYDHDVFISIKIDRNKRKVVIADNCVGMNKEELKRLAEEINNSDKAVEKGRPWINGQFGLGAHAFRHSAQTLVVTSKRKDTEQATIRIRKLEPDAELFDNYLEVQTSLLEGNEPIEIKGSGTIVEIRDIDKGELKNLTIDQLKKDIELHFEILLKRNVEIKIMDGENEVLCVPFDYDSIEGLSIKKTIDSWNNNLGVTTIVPLNKIEINIKICKRNIERPVYFVSRGRRIASAKDLKSFKNYVDRSILTRGNAWTNVLLTGYIDVKNNLEPTVHRNDFVNNNERTAIYKAIMGINDTIFDAIQEEMKISIPPRERNAGCCNRLNKDVFY